ncbi:hypothetical protein M4I21_12860 [Cellulophaga sp. 20_2_10]|uniref:hypothetical protein n=1 Tax=Cellulophaga sp. 20_2_10 TaxID=2942476 RepID=UPI00201ABEB4|nr:hypothetical protein [Cellulophaga sp. 20_2_10]MCL5246708.1 hypothetical protein [Cellulophaga sp. 20_2_10]
MKQLLLSLLLTFALTSCQTEEEFQSPEEQAEATTVVEEVETNDDQTNDDDDDDDDDSDDDQGNQNSEESGITKTLLTSILLKNSWSLKNLTEKKGVTDYINRSAKFSGFTFVFKDSGEVIAEADNTVIDGSWTITGDEKQGLLVMLDFNNNTSEFSSLNNSWPISSLSQTSMGYVHGNLDITANKDNRVFLSFDKVN